MSRLDEVGTRDGWRCWLCDEAVDPDKSVNDARGPSVDSMSTARATRASKDAVNSERLAHRSCNTRKGAVTPVIAWPARLFVSDPALLFGVVERLQRKGGREVVARCPSKQDAQEAADWLLDRFPRLAPQLSLTAPIQPGGGQFLVALDAGRRP